jgi:hypothetical protein
MLWGVRETGRRIWLPCTMAEGSGPELSSRARHQPRKGEATGGQRGLRA